MTDKDRDWDKELAKIDKAMESMSDEQLYPSAAAKTPGAKSEVAAVQRTTSTFGVFVRLVLAVALGVGILFWPYQSRCGAGLAGYLGAVLAVLGAGVWSSIWTWRHRAGRAHILSLLLALWGLLLATVELLPRMGYAKQSLPWTCSVEPPPAAPAPPASPNP
jgi:hypothetical protein